MFFSEVRHGTSNYLHEEIDQQNYYHLRSTDNKNDSDSSKMVYGVYSEFTFEGNAFKRHFLSYPDLILHSYNKASDIVLDIEGDLDSGHVDKISEIHN